MNILFITKGGMSETMTTDILPRVGDNVDMFYRPYPNVVGVLLYPSDAVVNLMRQESTVKIDAIVTLD